MQTRKDDLVIESSTLVGHDFSARKPDSFIAIHSTFDGCNFSGIRVRSATFAAGTQPTIYRNCKFDGFKTQGPGVVGPARFEQCSFENVVLKGLRCDVAEFVDCRFSGRLEASYFNGTPSADWATRLHRTANEFRNNDFSRAAFVDVEFRTGIDLRLQRLPIDSERYLYCENPEPHLLALRQRFLSHQDLDERRQAFAILSDLESLIASGQKQLFICKDTMKPFSKSVLSEVYHELTS